MVKIGELAYLTEPEQRLAKFLAQARYNNARSRGLKDQKIGPQSTAETDLEGIAAEIAFCKLFNVYPDLQLDERSPYDALVNGVRVDVKTTHYVTGKLLAAPWKKTKALPIDAFVLMVGKFPGPYEFKGFMQAKTLLDTSRIVDLGWGRGYAARQDELSEECWKDKSPILELA
jgi:hypothetical protein